MRRSNFDKFPVIPAGGAELCHVGWSAIAAQMNSGRVICIECYPGVDEKRLERELLPKLGPRTVFRSSIVYKSSDCIRKMLHSLLGDDPVFGRMNGLTLEDWFDEDKAAQMRSAIASHAQSESIVVIGSGASLLVTEADALVYADMARWEIQMRFRRGELGKPGLR